ncbi:MAG TPA: choice-of-anchor D domain-containing protein [Candidatus Binataceae bacterium]|nr:choice-of-anchor D domain-containing protein [Candidatus Binataceae bacterium]
MNAAQRIVRFHPRQAPLAIAILFAITASAAYATTTASISATALNFGSSVQIGTSVNKSVTLTNNGLTSLTVSGATLSDPTQFGIFNNTCPAGGLAAGQTCTITVVFTPRNPGAQNATLTISDNGDTSPQIVNLTGTAAVQNTNASASPNPVNFGSVPIGSSAQAVVTLKNIGFTYSLYVTGAAQNDAADFGIVANTCTGGATTAQSQCVIELNFAPQSIGPASGTLTITDNTTGGSQTVGLTGTATASTAIPVSLSATALNFGSSVMEGSTVTQTVTVTNNQNVPLDIFSFDPPTTSSFAIVSNNCGYDPDNGVTLAANGGTCTVTLSFTPQSVGQLADALAVEDDADSSPQVVNLSGTGTIPVTTDTITPSPATFSGTAAGYSSQQTLTVKNTGTNPLFISGMALSDPLDFGIASNGCPMAPNSLAANSSCTIAVNYAPQPSGSTSGTLTIANNTASGTDAVSLTGPATTIPCPIGQDWGPGPPQANPQVFYSGEDTVLTVTAPVSANPALIPGSVMLLRVDSNGNQIGDSLGQIYDDGPDGGHGDAHIGDGLYTGQFTFHEPAISVATAQPIYLAVQAAYSAGPSCRQSNNNDLPIVVGRKRATPDELQVVDDVKQAASAHFQELTAPGGQDEGNPGQAILDLVPLLLTQAGVSDAGVTEDGTTVWVSFESGLSEIYIGILQPNVNGSVIPKSVKGGASKRKTKEGKTFHTQVKEANHAGRNAKPTPPRAIPTTVPLMPSDGTRS